MSSLIQTGLFDTRVRLEVLDISDRDSKARFNPQWNTLTSIRGRFTSTTSGERNTTARMNRETTGKFHCATMQLSPTIPAVIREGRRVRIVWDEASETRYFEVLGMPVDKGERRRQTRFDIVERDANWIGRP